MSQISLPVLLKIRDVASILQCSTRHVSRLILSGKIPVVRVGQLVRVKREELEKFIDQ